MDNFIILFLINWSPTFIWTSLCIFGIFYAFKEIKECYEDMSIIEKIKESFKYIVAHGNTKNARRSIGVQTVFLLTAALVAYLKVQEPDPWTIDSQISLIRALVVPGMFIVAELLLILNLREQSQIRKKIKEKVNNRKERGDG